MAVAEPVVFPVWPARSWKEFKSRDTHWIVFLCVRLWEGGAGMCGVDGESGDRATLPRPCGRLGRRDLGEGVRRRE